ncbi:MAG: acetoacetate--CoA ligase [Rhodobiaceae bacterium]|nr:acetoacetate--CoA ligase [Rhodobiaceae bacterium]MCC0052269.1 acetoacetate--CoA ligase [Rhodobiaceae bacterium]MCC0059744.1 acetoacetate--CoA ligase [Rhodobiaceae bacterium]
MTDTPLWTPDADRADETQLARFMAEISAETGQTFASYPDFHRWSVENRETFWSRLWDFARLVGEKGDRVIAQDTMPGAVFFPDAKLNFAENLLAPADTDPQGDAFVFWGEDKVRRRMSWEQLRALVSRLQQALQAAGVAKGDRVAAMMPNMPETIAGMLAASSIGAVWSSCSPDFGTRGVLDRFGQIEPKVLITCDGYWYAGKRIEVAAKLGEIVPQLPTLSAVVVVPYLEQATEVAAKLPNGTELAAFIEPFEAKAPEFLRLPPDHPLYILFSSGTTGIPKCIVHSAGGTLLQHVKEHRLHCDIRPGDRFFYFTTCGWMMWNWLASGLATGATLLLYDGSPFHPDGNILFDYADAEGMTMFGTSAKFIDSVRKAELRPIATHKLEHLRLMTSTGSPLSPEGFSFVYDGIRKDMQLASISGGTDIVACFVGGNPISPVYVGEIQGPMLAMATEVWDDDGKPMQSGKGELVCTKAFPSMPIMFWNDPGGHKYRAAYFERFDGIWCHGDFAEWTGHGGMIIHGRSDATLNPGGVRIGTAEIYAQVEQMPEVIEALAIGQTWDDDVRVVLFVRLADDVMLDDELTAMIRKRIREGASPRHVPARVVAVKDIPRTKSGKITELAVRDVVHGREVKNQEALANPEALEFYRDIPELKS